ncbi:MAG: ArgE/DapE family deacylase [Chloroflexota bacterium]|nr:ArgE/DapE family deacylase [Chloroflexota bacterium]
MERPSGQDVSSLLMALVGIDSINPSLMAGAAGESGVAEYVADWLRAAGLPVELQEVLPGRPNVVARIGGTGHGRSLMLNAHLDTVGVAGMTDPFRPRVEGDRLYGRGAYDMKAGLAAIMLAARSVQRAGGAQGDLIVTAVMDEECASAGTEAVLRRYQADGVIVTEPTGLRLCTAHKGFAWLSVSTEGRAAHGSRPDLGVDAIAHMGRVLVHLEALGKKLAQGQGHPLLGTGSIHASLIEGGQELSSYPERCRLQIERRTIPGETPESVLEEIRAALQAQSANDPSFRAEAELLFWREPFEVNPGAPIVQTVEQAAIAITGGRPQVYGDTPWMDAALLSSAGIPTVVFGPGGEGAHAVVEWASISQTATCAEILAQAAMDYCAG